MCPRPGSQEPGALVLLPPFLTPGFSAPHPEVEETNLIPEVPSGPDELGQCSMGARSVLCVSLAEPTIVTPLNTNLGVLEKVFCGRG